MRVQKIRIERHDVDRVCLIEQGGRRRTVLDLVREGKWLRWDIMLINVTMTSECPTCGHDREELTQLTVYPEPRGEISYDEEAEVHLLPEDREWLRAESAKIWEVCLKHKEVAKAVFDS